MKATRIYTLLALLLMAGGIHLQAQLRIDWQQTYGGQLPNCDDEAWGIAPTDDGILSQEVGVRLFLGWSLAISVNKLQGTGS